MDTGAGAKNGNGKSDSTPSDQSAIGPGPGAVVPAPSTTPKNGNGKHHDAAATAAPATSGKEAQKATQFKSGDERQNPGGLTKDARAAAALLHKEFRGMHVVKDASGEYREAKKAERKAANKAAKEIILKGLNSKDPRAYVALLDKLFPDATPIAAQVQISNNVPPSTNPTNDGRNIVPHLSDPGVRQSVVDLVAQLEARGAFTGGAGPARN